LRPPEIFEPYGSTLYHYTRLETAMEKILAPRSGLMMSFLESMRDPRESGRWALTVGGFGGDHDVEEFRNDSLRFAALDDDLNAPAAADDGLRKRIRVLCFTIDDPRVEEATTLFDWGFAHPRLWEHYGQKHRGVCLCFDRAKLTQLIEEQLDGRGNLIHRDVAYENEPIAPEALFMEVAHMRSSAKPATSHVVTYASEFLFKKAADWQTEIEYRFVLVLVNDYEEGSRPRELTLPFRDALKAIVLGRDVDNVYFPSLNQLGRNHGADVFRVFWTNGVPRLTPPP
jgi:Protein of unknown function (DUF2971)